jgi:D-xylose transport system substrate-binding protein
MGSKVNKWILIMMMCGFILIIFVFTLLNKPKPQEYEGVRRTENEQPLIGLSVDGMVIERWQHDVDIFKTKAEELGYHVEVTNAYEDVQKQIEQIRMLANEGAKAIVIIACDKDSLSEVIEEVKKKDIVVIAYDRLIMRADVDAYISFDNIAVGEHMARALIEVQPEGNYVIINGAPTDYNASMFNEGYYNNLKPYIDDGSIVILEEVWAENWREEFAYNTVSRLLEKGKNIDAIIGANDRIAEGAISVLLEYGLVGEIPVVGHDADISACQNIVEGKQLMTVYKPIKTLAEGAVNTVDQLINGHEITYQETIFDGEYEVPYIQYDVVPVYDYNMRETVIKDLFHNEEDVYLKQ